MTTPPITPLDREAAADFMAECAPYLGDCGMKNSVELALRQAFARRTAAERATSPAGDAGEVERIAKLCETYAAAVGTSDEDTERPFEDGMTLAGYTLAGMIRDRFSAALLPQAGDADVVGESGDA